VLVAARRQDEAIRVLRDVVAEDPSQLDAYALLARLHAANGQLDRAIAAYDAIAKQSRAPAAAFTMIALLQEARGDREAAQEAYEKALAADPAVGTAANNLAWIYAEGG